MQWAKQKLIGAYEALKKGIFITASCLIILIALRNSLIWHLENIWGGSKNLWSSIWGVLFWMSGESFFLMFVFVSAVSTFTVFILANVFFTILDLTGKPAALLKYKIQEDKGVPVNWEKYKKAIWLVTFNSLIIGPLTNFILYPLAMWRGMDAGYELPSFATAVWHFIGYLVIEEIGFYYSHRLLHHPKLYKYIHKIHHEWTAPTGIASIYAHPLEHLISNVGVVVLGPIVMGSHLSIAFFWYSLAVMNSTSSHSGYHLPFMPSSEAHDFHHLKFNQNYGVMGVLDRLHGTDETFRRSKNYERHVVLLGLDSAKQLFPNPPKKTDGGKCE